MGPIGQGSEGWRASGARLEFQIGKGVVAEFLPDFRDRLGGTRLSVMGIVRRRRWR